jgi:cobalamin biosynthesis protein CobT
MVVRDLWAYQLAMHHLPPRPSVHSPDADHNTEARNEDLETAEGKQEEDGSDGSPKSDSDTESDVDPGLLNDIENISDEENNAEGADDGRKTGKKKRPLRISDTLVCLIVGLWVLRYPVMNVDIEQSVSLLLIPLIC